MGSQETLVGSPSLPCGGLTPPTIPAPLVVTSLDMAKVTGSPSGALLACAGHCGAVRAERRSLAPVPLARRRCPGVTRSGATRPTPLVPSSINP